MDASAGTPNDAFGATVAATMHTALDNGENLQLLTEREARRMDLTDELERLTRVNQVIRRIDRSLVRASTRSEIETVACEELAGFDADRLPRRTGVPTRSRRPSDLWQPKRRVSSRSTN